MFTLKKKISTFEGEQSPNAWSINERNKDFIPPNIIDDIENPNLNTKTSLKQLKIYKRRSTVILEPKKVEGGVI